MAQISLNKLTNLSTNKPADLHDSYKCNNIFLDRGTFFVFHSTISRLKLDTLYNMRTVVKLQSCEMRIWNNGKNSAFFFFLSPFCFSNCLEYLSLKFISKQSFPFSRLTAHCLYLSLAFLLFCSVLWTLYNILYLHEISCTYRARTMTHSYLCLQAHIAYVFLQDSEATQCLINWLDFLPESFSIEALAITLYGINSCRLIK